MAQNSKSIGKNIKEFRKLKKITQAQLGKLINKSESTIRKYELGEVEPNIETIKKIAEVLDVSSSAILGIGLLDDNFAKDFIKVVAKMKNENIFAGTDGIKNGLENFLKTYIPQNSLNKISRDTLLEKEITFISDSKVEETFNYSYIDLAYKGYDKLLIKGLEKSIKDTLADINEHLQKGDIFDGVSNWISKDSPLYEVYKKHLEDNKDK